MYAIAFDLDTELLKTTYPNLSWNNACADIRRRLETHGFAWRQGSVYFGDESVMAVTWITYEEAASIKTLSRASQDILAIRNLKLRR